MGPSEHDERSRRPRAVRNGPPPGPLLEPRAGPTSPAAEPRQLDLLGAGPPETRFPGDPDEPPRTRGDGIAWVLTAIGGFVVGQIVALGAIDVAASLTGNGSRLSAISKLDAPPEWYVLSSLIGLWVGFGLAPWLASRMRGTGRLLADLGLRFRWLDALGILVGVVGQLVVSAVYAPFIHHIHDFSAPTRKLTGSSHGFGFAVIALFTVIGAPFFEELFFRGLLLRGLVRWFAPVRSSARARRVMALAAAVVADGLLFGLAHGELVQLAGLAIFGAMLAAVALRTGRLGMNMVAHATFNLVVVLSIVNNGGGVLR